MKDTLDPLDVLIGARIRLRREQLKLTQTQIGEHLGVTFQQVQKYEKGHNRVAASRIAALAALLKVPNMYFFSGQIEGRQEERLAIDERFISLMSEQDRAARRLLTAFSRIEDAQSRMKVVAIVEAVADAFGVVRC